MRFTDCVRGTLTLADGAWGTELLRAGGQLTDCLDAWNLTKSDHVRRVAESYVRAGSRVILTNTFRANPISLARHDLRDQCGAINRAGVRLSRQAAGNSAMVFASMGPIRCGLPRPNTSRGALQQAFSEQARALAAETPDALLIETMTDLEEARVAAEAALATRLPVVVSFVFLLEYGELRAPDGSTPLQVASVLARDGVHAVGANCCTVRDSVSICRHLAAATTLPIWIKPNAGLPQITNGTPLYTITPQEFAAFTQELRDAGATFLGGCCGTTPDFIRALADHPSIPSTAAKDS